MFLPIGKNRQRFEFALLKHEDIAEWRSRRVLGSPIDGAGAPPFKPVDASPATQKGGFEGRAKLDRQRRSAKSTPRYRTVLSIDAAFKEFVKNGYAATRLEDAPHAQASQGTVYFYFDTKRVCVR